MRAAETPHRSKTLRVVFTAAEADPFVKVGGLGDVAGSVPVQLQKISQLDGKKIQIDIRLVLPYYPIISPRFREQKPIAEFTIPTRKIQQNTKVYSTKFNNVIVYLIEGKPISRSNSVYSRDSKVDGDKFVFFSLACLQLIEILDFKPHILHANDWHTALTIYAQSLNRSQKSNSSHPATLITLHNLPFMGVGAESSLKKYGIPPSKHPDLPEWSRQLPLPMGLSTADAIVAVSPTYAREIQTEAFGCGLENFLGKNQSKIFGIINGLDYHTWNPEIDPCIEKNYSSQKIEFRSENKAALQAEFDLPCDKETPLLILISRMDIQKGIDLAVESLKRIASLNWQAIFLGSGDPVLETQVLELEKLFPSRFRAALRFDSSLSHRMYAGGDILLMPSRYEPCGLSQLIAMRYGCIPVARATGGLVDTIQVSPKKEQTGYLFPSSTPASMVKELEAVLRDIKSPFKWKAMQRRAMSKDFSWDNSAIEYARLYLDLINNIKRS
jgi:starch synthase